MTRCRVLLLEDNTLVAEALRETLGLLGHACMVARNIEEARLIAVEHRDLDVALVDAGLRAGEYGVDFLVWLTANRPTVRRILISGLEPPPLGELVVHHFLKKPFGLPELMSALSG